MMSSSNSVRHEWFQSAEHVVLSIFAKGCSAERFQIDFGGSPDGTQLNITIDMSEKLDKSRLLQFDFDLAGRVSCSQEDLLEPRFMPSKVEIKLKKAVEGLMWPKFERDPSEDPEISTSAAPVIVDTSAGDKPPAYPSSSKKRVDWNQLDRQAQQDLENEKPEGDQALNALFQQIYRDGNEETKRAMMKSFVESGGTCLSTNWNEVGKERVPIRPPDGMEVKKYES